MPRSAPPSAAGLPARASCARISRSRAAGATASSSACCPASFADALEQRVGEPGGPLGGGQHEVRRAAQERLDLREVVENLGELGRILPVAVAAAGPKPLDKNLARRGEQNPQGERQLGLLLRAAGEEGRPAGLAGEELGDPVRPPAPASVRPRFAEAVVVSVIRRVAATAQLGDQRRPCRRLTSRSAAPTPAEIMLAPMSLGD